MSMWHTYWVTVLWPKRPHLVPILARMQDQPNKTIDEVIDNALTAAFEGYDTQNSPPEGESEFDRAAEYQSCSAKDTESISDNE